MSDQYCNGPLTQCGITDKGLPLWYCETCKMSVLGYNHERSEPSKTEENNTI